MTKKEKQYLAIAKIIYGFTIASSFYINTQTSNQVRFTMTFVAILCPFILPIAFKIFKWKPIFEISMINIVFCYFAALWGSCLGGYSTAYFDKIVHFAFGFCGIMIAYLLYCYIKRSLKIESLQEFKLFLVFINAVNITIAVFWEYYEYALLVFFNNDAVNHYTTGVHDSMTDMIVCTLGGFIVTFSLIRAYRKHKTSIYHHLIEKFYLVNIQK